MPEQSRIDLNAANVMEHELTVEEARDFVDGIPDLVERVVEWFDAAQGPVFSSERPAVYLVIKIAK